MPTTAERNAWMAAPVSLTGDELLIGGRQVMQAWERPVMAAMASGIAGGGAASGFWSEARFLVAVPTPARSGRLGKYESLSRRFSERYKNEQQSASGEILQRASQANG